jgi:hypothetical protein
LDDECGGIDPEEEGRGGCDLFKGREEAEALRDEEVGLDEPERAQWL